MERKKRKGWTLIFLKLARGAGVVANAGWDLLCGSLQPHSSCSVRPCGGWEAGCVCWKEESGETEWLWLVANSRPININKNVIYTHILWLPQSCMLDQLRIFTQWSSHFPYCLCAWEFSVCLNVRRNTLKYALKGYARNMNLQLHYGSELNAILLINSSLFGHLLW